MIRTPSRTLTLAALIALCASAVLGCSRERADSSTVDTSGSSAGTARQGHQGAAGTLGAAGNAADRDADAQSGMGETGAGSSAAADAGGASAGSADVTCHSALPVVQVAETERALRGEALFRNVTLTPGILPEVIVRNLWVAWGTPPPASDQDFWAEARRRYGMVETPYDNGGLPAGMRREGSGIAFECMLCHTGRIAGTTVIGAANGTIDLESFFDDLQRMNELAPSLGLPSLPIPFDLDGFTFAAGAHDAFGLGFRLVGPLAAGLHTEFGAQRPPAWWLLKHKQRVYLDGSGDASGHNTMAATLVAFGITPDQIAARDEDFVDIAHYIRSLQPPCWTLSALDAEKVARGREVFDRTCASCHGVHTGQAAQFPNMVVDRSVVGTDPVRAERFGADEAQRLNGSWFGNPPFTPTGGYLAQPLTGIWARAPYFHNGSVPDLLGVLDPSQRPVRWRRIGSEIEDYDPERVGLRYKEIAVAPDPSTQGGRLVYDTTRESMSDTGHTYGAALSAAERSDVLEYLRSL